MKVLLGADAFGTELRNKVREHLEKRGVEVTAVGEDSLPYYETAARAARAVSRGEADRALLVCGSGMGMAIIANKFPGVYAAVCENRLAAERARSINNANVLTLGGMVTPADTARDIVDAWLDTAFKAGWDPNIQQFLEQSMKDIAAMEKADVRT
jgi:ribose 5-phosphate isomerase B